MDFVVQMGYGSQGAIRELLNKWGTGNVVMSARAFRPAPDGSIDERMIRFSREIVDKCRVLIIDPLMYSSGRAIKQLAATEYWRASGGFPEENYRHVVDELSKLNVACSTSAMILPSSTALRIDKAWMENQRRVIDYAARYYDSTMLIPTVSVCAGVLKDMLQIENLMKAIDSWDTGAIYLTCEHPNGDYLVDDPQWLLNLMLLSSWIKRSGKKLFVGYASHQMLQLVLAKCDYICSGNFLNVRRFKTADYLEGDFDSPSRRVKWYYAPHMLSEFRLVTLDIAFQDGLLDLFKSPYGNTFSEKLFGGALPSGTAYKESDSFLHYLHSLHEQCRHYSTASYEESLASIRSTFNAVESMLNNLKELGINDRSRSFFSALPSCYQAIDAFDMEMGFQMSRSWNEM